MRGVPSRRRRRAREGAHPSMRDRARAGDDARSPGPKDERSRLGCGACRAAGGDEHARERIRRCVTERAQETTPGSAASAPKMRVRFGGFGLRTTGPMAAYAAGFGVLTRMVGAALVRDFRSGLQAG